MARIAFANPPGLYDPSSHGYAHVAVVESTGPVVYVAGQGGERADGTLPTSRAEQMARAFSNLRTALEGVGGRLDRVVKLTTYVVDHDDDALAELTHAVRSAFGDSPPTQTLVPVARLALDGMKFEVDAVAHLDEPG